VSGGESAAKYEANVEGGAPEAAWTLASTRLVPQQTACSECCSMASITPHPFTFPHAPPVGDGDYALEPDVVPDLPPSWVPKLTLPRDIFDMRCPKVGGAPNATSTLVNTNSAPLP
jgi:hypothetical protein